MPICLAERIHFSNFGRGLNEEHLGKNNLNLGNELRLRYFVELKIFFINFGR